jgi:sulfur carrier protein
MRVRLRNPDREVEVAGGRTVREVLGELDVNPDTVLVIRAGELVTREVVLTDADRIEVRPVISGGAPAADGSDR